MILLHNWQKKTCLENLADDGDQHDFDPVSRSESKIHDELKIAAVLGDTFFECSPFLLILFFICTAYINFNRDSFCLK
jgi:hypothetical protein